MPLCGPRENFHVRLIASRASLIAVALLAIAPLLDGCKRVNKSLREHSGHTEKTEPAPPAFDMTREQTERLLFPRNFGPADPSTRRCIPDRRGGNAPSWLSEALATLSCPAEAREALASAASTREDQLTVAALCDDADAARRLVTAGANPNRRDSCGWTALVAAATAGHAGVVEVLLGAGARPNFASEAGSWSRTPLLAAVARGDTGVARRLLRAHANPRLTTTGGRDALMLAATWGDDDLVRTLLRYNADACRQDHLGATALGLSRACGHDVTATTLLRAARQCGRKTKSRGDDAEERKSPRRKARRAKADDREARADSQAPSEARAD